MEALDEAGSRAWAHMMVGGGERDGLTGTERWSLALHRLRCSDCQRGVACPKLVELSEEIEEARDARLREARRPSLAAIPEYPVEALPADMRGLVLHAQAAGLPAALAAGAALAALAAATGPYAELEALLGWIERAILWVANLAPRGAGKTPCQSLAFKPLRDRDGIEWRAYRRELEDWQSKPAKERGPKPIDSTFLAGDMTLEALVRLLDGHGGSLALDVDELTQLLRGLGEYKRGGGGDRGRFLQLWSASPWRYTRVGGDTDILIPRPTVVICGGLQPALHHLLGGEEDGMRPRWLPHLAAMPEQEPTETATEPPKSWASLLTKLLGARDTSRRWTLTDAARARFLAFQKQWKAESRAGEAASVSAALIKADVHLLRIALLLAEAENPGAGGDVCPEIVERAAAMVTFTLDCWRALPEYGSLALTYRDEKLDRAVDRLRDWLEQHSDRATKRELLRRNVAGARTAADLAKLLDRYEATYPGTVTEERPARGPATVVVSSPRRDAPRRSTYSPKLSAADSFQGSHGGAGDGISSSHWAYEGDDE